MKKQKHEFRSTPYGGKDKCIYCDGWGRVLVDNPQAEDRVKCTDCGGTGRAKKVDILGKKNEKLEQQRLDVIAALISSQKPLTFDELKKKAGSGKARLSYWLECTRDIQFFDKRTGTYRLRKPVKDVLGI